jgi:hypothetical protein
MFKARKGFWYALFATGQVGLVYLLFCLFYFIGQDASPKSNMIEMIGVGFILMVVGVSIVAVVVAAGFGLHYWGKWTMKIATKQQRKLERYFGEKAERARFALIRRKREEMEARSAARREASNIGWEV